MTPNTMITGVIHAGWTEEAMKDLGALSSFLSYSHDDTKRPKK